MSVLVIILAIICVVQTVCIIVLNSYAEFIESKPHNEPHIDMDFMILAQLSARLQAVEVELARRERENDKSGSD